MDGFEIHDPAFRRMVLPNAPLVKLGEGFAWLEGPVWFADQDCLLVSDLPNDRILRWSEGGGVSVFRAPAGFPNGHARDRQGRLLGCSHQHRRITRTELDGSVSVLAGQHEGRQLNAPNDVVCRSDGTIWFTDPHYGINTDYEGGKQEAELPPSLYRLDPDTCDLRSVGGSFEGPNGLCFSPDERLLYVAESGSQFAADPVRHIRVYEVSADGAELQGGRVFHTVEPGFADGIRCDGEGNLWTSAADGVHCTRRTAARANPGAVYRIKPRFRRPQAVPAVHLRVTHTLRDLHQRARDGAPLTRKPTSSSALSLSSATSVPQLAKRPAITTGSAGRATISPNSHQAQKARQSDA